MRPTFGVCYRRLLRPLLFQLDAEAAHRLTLAMLARIPAFVPRDDPPELRTEVFGLPFSNPIGLAAGMDKDARAPHAWNALGFGFAEIGTVTPRPQPGNPRPRMFRLEADEAVINRLGFNNEGIEAMRHRLADRGRGIVGVNVGANKDTQDLIADYVSGLEAFAGLA